ncbi:MAG: sigma 54-interacting transcriptional regulator [Clostridiales bacterium]
MKQLSEEQKYIKKLEAKLAKSELLKSQYYDIVDNLSECVDREDPDYGTLYVNKAFCDFYDVSEDEAIKINGMDWIVPKDRERVNRQIKMATPEFPDYHYTCQVLTKHGKTIWIEVMGRNFYDANGNVIESQDVSRDITQYKEAQDFAEKFRGVMEEKVRIRTLELNNLNKMLQKSNSYLQNTLNIISEGVISVNERGDIKLLNYGTNKKWFSRETEIINKIKKDLKTKNSMINQLIFEEKSFQNIEYTFPCKLENINCLASGVSFHEGNYKAGLLTFRPIDEIKRLVNKFSNSQAIFDFDDIIGNSTQIKDAINFADKIAIGEGNVVIEGESGTGKELFAHAIHNNSPRKAGPFVAINCGAIPRDLIGSELFGYIEGSFTGAKKGGKPGKFEMASGGTIFLDEIGDMPLEQQISLLRVIQERTVVRIGGHQEIAVDVRIICATNKNLLNEVNNNNFRKDLYYRLNVISLEIPPLRERKDDIPILFKHFFNKLSNKKHFTQNIDPKIMEVLKSYNWPGNIRELQNITERIYYLTNGEKITYDDLPIELITHESNTQQSMAQKHITQKKQEPVKNKTIAAYLQDQRNKAILQERDNMIDLLEKNSGNISKAAKELGISRTTFYRKMQKYIINED